MQDYNAFTVTSTVSGIWHMVSTHYMVPKRRKGMRNKEKEIVSPPPTRRFDSDAQPLWVAQGSPSIDETRAD